jgi:hypothetical protein
MGNSRAFLAGILFVLAIVAVAAGIMYLLLPAHSLPSFFPGHISHGRLASAKHTVRGYAGLGAGIVLLVVAMVLLGTTRRRRYRPY